MLKYWSVLIYLTISLIVHCFVGRLGFLVILVVKLGGWCKDTLLYHTNRSEVSLAPTSLLKFSRINLIAVFRTPAGECGWSNCVVGLFCYKIFPSPVLPASVVNVLSWSLAKRAKHCFPVTTFFNSFKFSSSVSIQFHSVFFSIAVSFDLFFSNSLALNFATFCFALRNDFNSMLEVSGFICKRAFLFCIFRFTQCSFFSCPSQVVSLRKNSDSLPLALCRAFWSFSSMVSIFFRCHPLSRLLLK